MKAFLDSIDIHKHPIGGKNGIKCKLEKLSIFCLNLIPNNKYRYFTKMSPFKKWKRIHKQNMFKYGQWKRPYPKGELEDDLKGENNVVIVEGYNASGSFSSVKTKSASSVLYPKLSNASRHSSHDILTETNCNSPLLIWAAWYVSP